MQLFTTLRIFFRGGSIVSRQDHDDRQGMTQGRDSKRPASLVRSRVRLTFPELRNVFCFWATNPQPCGVFNIIAAQNAAEEKSTAMGGLGLAGLGRFNGVGGF